MRSVRPPPLLPPQSSPLGQVPYPPAHRRIQEAFRAAPPKDPKWLICPPPPKRLIVVIFFFTSLDVFFLQI